MDFSQSTTNPITTPSSSSPIQPIQTPPLSSSQNIEKEHLFDKIVTPSDVGKLNRLVIPKQHAERCFPLDTSTNEKGLLLNFEDRLGKQWRFRYSYWNSSQSYVMTKGWSRFVKEKRLNAGDTVSFGRAVQDKDRLFIDWRRRPEVVRSASLPRHVSYPMLSFGRSVVPRSNYLYNVGGGGGEQFLVFRTPIVDPRPVGRVDGTLERPIVLDSVPVVVPSNNIVGRRVRLFGVDFDLPMRVEESTSSSSSSALPLTLPLEEEKEDQKDEPSLDLEM